MRSENLNLNVGTLNVRGLTSEIRQQQLARDLDSYKLDILCIQETKITKGESPDDTVSLDRTFDQGRLICFCSSSPHYGNGFFIPTKWIDDVHDTWRVSDRICVIQLNIRHSDKKLGKKGRPDLFTIINVYAPTSSRAEQHPEELEQVYTNLYETFEKDGKNTFVILAGDFNAKVGAYEDGDTCIGQYSKGKRNENGRKLLEFCENKNLFITNSAFPHPSRHQTTWNGQWRNSTTGALVKIYNQIDYVICHKRYRHLVTNSRSYSGTIITTDHNLVKTTFRINWVKVWHRNKTKGQANAKINVSSIANDSACQNEYKNRLESSLRELGREPQNSTPDQLWLGVQSAIKQSAEESAGLSNKPKQNRTPCPIISNLSTQQKELRIRINNCKDESDRIKLKGERNRILHEIQKQKIKLRNEELDKKANEITNAGSDDVMFRAVKTLNAKRYENPIIEDENGRLIINPNDILTEISNHFENKFSDPQTPNVESFSGQPRDLDKPITTEEVRKGFESLRNNKAPGEDGIYPELLKYGPKHLDNVVANVLNNTFSQHKSPNINSGTLIAIPKPGKRKGPPKNLRPITLLNTIRKVLSIIVLKRIRPKVEEYLSSSQSGFRPERSTADIVWTHKWLAAKTLSEDVEIKVTGIDMSAAFDTINRQKLLEILKNIVEEDELRIIQFLLSETEIKTRVSNANVQKSFTSNVGTPQGDSLSPVLFTIYLENALKEVRTTIGDPACPLDTLLPREIAYADDVDFVGSEFISIQDVQKTLDKYQLSVNVDKTELTTLKREDDSWKHTKKVGSLIGDIEDVARRKQLATAALNKLTNVWIRGDKIQRQIRLKLYRALVKSILTYNCGTWALTQKETEKLDAFHRKQLRRVLNIRYPVVISNKSLYKITNEKPLSITITESRWQLLGHILRRDDDIPANKSMKAYFVKISNKYRGRPLTTLPIVINKDLERLTPPTQLKTASDLKDLKHKAQDRKLWATLSRRIVKEAEAARPVDLAAEGP